MATPPRHLSKSRFCTGLQCPRRLWWEVHERDAPELRPDPALQSVFDLGHQVGARARAAFPGGALIDLEPWQVSERVAATAAAIARGAPAIFEASFAAGGAFAALDVLERDPDGWTLVEVKATLRVKPQFLPDVALQLHAARSAGLPVRRAQVMHLARPCADDGSDAAFVRVDLTDAAEALAREVPRQLDALRAALAGPLPAVEPGARCVTPYACPFQGRCGPAAARGAPAAC